MKTITLLPNLFFISLVEFSYAACGPDWCCSRPRLCARGPEISKWYAGEKACLDQADYGVDGTIVISSLGYPFSIMSRSSGQEAARSAGLMTSASLNIAPGFLDMKYFSFQLIRLNEI